MKPLPNWSKEDPEARLIRFRNLMRAAGDETLIDGELRRPVYIGAALRYAAESSAGATYFAGATRPHAPFFSAETVETLRAQMKLAAEEIRRGLGEAQHTDEVAQAITLVDEADAYFSEMVVMQWPSEDARWETMKRKLRIHNAFVEMMGADVDRAIVEAYFFGHFRKP